MTDRQRAFVAHYLATLNAAKAARHAGYSARVADREGYRLLRNAEIQAAVQAGKARQLAAADLSAQRVLEELRRLAFSNIAYCFDPAGNLLPIQALPAEVRSAVASVKVITRNLTTGDGVVDTIHELKFWDKPRNLEMLARHFGLIKERVEHRGSVEVVDILKGRVARAKTRGKA